MSRYYEMQVGIALPSKDSGLEEKIFAACAKEWPFTAFELWPLTLANTNRMEMTEQSYLSGGESEDEFVDRLSGAVWAAAEQPLAIEVRATYLEDLPYEKHTRDKVDYGRWLEEQAHKQEKNKIC